MGESTGRKSEEMRHQEKTSGWEEIIKREGRRNGKRELGERNDELVEEK